MYQQLRGYKVEEKLYLGVREQKRLNTTALRYCVVWTHCIGSLKSWTGLACVFGCIC
jgi:hypothetical protein